MEKELENICEDLKVGYEIYPLYRKVNNIILFLKGKEEKKNIIVDYTKIDNIDVLIKLRDFYKKYNFEEELEEIQYQLDNKLVEYKKYVKYCCSLKPIPLETKYYSHIIDSIDKINFYLKIKKKLYNV